MDRNAKIESISVNITRVAGKLVTTTPLAYLPEKKPISTSYRA
jgi:hypothetical protein